MSGERVKSRSMQGKLVAYSAAAGAAIALGSQAEAAILYYEGPWSSWASSPGTLMTLNSDGDVSMDGSYVSNWQFAFRAEKERVGSEVRYHMDVYSPASPYPNVATTAMAGKTENAAMFPEGALISDAHSGWWMSEAEMGDIVMVPVGYTPTWEDRSVWSGRGYLGLCFGEGPDRYYGWADVRLGHGYVSPLFQGPIVTLYGYAINPTGSIVAGDTGQPEAPPEPSEPIPEPSTLLLLALGAAGLTALRARRSGVA